MTPNELRQRIISLQRTLEQIKTQLETITEQGQTSAAQHYKSPPEPNRVYAKLSLPQSISSYYDTENKNQNSKTIWKRVEFAIALGGLLAVVAYVIVTARTLSEIKKQATTSQAEVRIMQKQLEATDRAWVMVELSANTEWVPGALVGGPLFV